MKKLAFFTLLPLLFAACSSAAPHEEAPSNADAILDNDIYNEAINAGEVSRCESIVDPTKKQECKDVIEARTISELALSKKDKSKCDDIKISRYADECRNSIDLFVQQEEAAAKFAEEQAKINAETNATTKKAFESSDSSLCKNIEDENQKYSCMYDVIANEALAKKDISVCDNIGRDDFIQRCKTLFNNDGPSS